jgi:hypothetical protein
MRTTRVVLLGLLLSWLGTPVSAQTIFVTFDIAGTDCDGNVAMNSPVTGYIHARLGDAPVFTQICTTGFSGIINGNCAAACPIAVTQMSWSQVKQLYD